MQNTEAKEKITCFIREAQRMIRVELESPITVSEATTLINKIKDLKGIHSITFFENDDNLVSILKFTHGYCGGAGYDKEGMEKLLDLKT